MRKIKLFLLLLLMPIVALETEIAQRSGNTIYMNDGQTCVYNRNEHRGSENVADKLTIYCYNGKRQSLLSIFETVVLNINIDDDDYKQYEGKTPNEVREHYDNDNSLFSLTLFSPKRSRLKLSPFEKHCIGIATDHQIYSVHLDQIRLDNWRIVQMSIGILLFFNAGRLSHNSLFYYLSGIMVGVSASFVLLVYVASKLVPQRSMMLGMVIGGWTLAVYVMKMISDNLKMILVTYREYVIWYLSVTSIISVLLCYRFGPPRNRRSKNIIKWILQILASLLIYYSSHFSYATILLIIIVLIINYFPIKFLRKMNTMYRRRYPRPRRLLTCQEYINEGARETNRSLHELREYVNSPNCRQWQIISTLNSPMRFAGFANGENHVTQAEIDEYLLNARNFNNVNGNDDDNDDNHGNDNIQFLQHPALLLQLQQQQQQQRQQPPPAPPGPDNDFESDDDELQDDIEPHDDDDDDDNDDDDNDQGQYESQTSDENEDINTTDDSDAEDNNEIPQNQMFRNRLINRPDLLVNDFRRNNYR